MRAAPPGTAPPGTAPHRHQTTPYSSGIMIFTSRLFSCGLRTPLFATSVAVSSGLLFAPLLQQSFRRPIRLDSSPAAISSKDWSYTENARTPIIKNGGLNRGAVRQMTTGSIIGLVAGLAISTFSKSLVLLIGLLIAGVQTAESYGIHIVPYKTMQKYVKSVDLRSAVQDNIAFKVSFGLMFALSAFAEL